MKSLTGARDSLLLTESSMPDIERYLRWIPIFGPPIANLLRGLRIRPVVEQIERELLRRHPPELSVWGEDIDRALFAQSVCELAMLEMGWPNDHFVPADPAAVVFWNHRDNLDFDATIKDLEFNLGVSLGASDLSKWFDSSLGEVVDDLWEKRTLTSD